ncbi:MAG: hypothetical protein K1X88_24875 [Nannocystaceae bacterium]|nr:hypothetical protein [Nannocystaceae bacterium]
MPITRRSPWSLFAFVLVASSAATASADPPFADQLTPGALRGIDLDPGDAWTLGYWEYLPSNYDELGMDERLPLLVFLPGIGEFDSDSSCPGNADWCTVDECNGDGLCRNLTWGPQLLIRTGQWDEDARPFIMVSPQNDVPTFSQQEWDLDELSSFFQFVLDNYPVDPRRMYLTGMSQGGRGTMQYVQANPRQFTAAVPTPGGQVGGLLSCDFADTAFWVFHGEDDQDGNLGPGVFNPCDQVEMLYAYNNPDQYPADPACVAAVGQPRPVGRMTMYYNVAHSSWVQTIDPINSGFPAAEWASDQGCGFDVEFREYSAANDADGIYSWFLALDRPDVTAPDDSDVVPSETQLVATVIDDDAVAYTWTQTAGPDATMANADSAALDLSDLQPLTDYTFEVLVVDDDGQWDRDEVTIHVTEAPAGSSSDGGGSSGQGSGSGSEGGSASTGGPADGSGSGSDGGSASASATATGGSASASATATGGTLGDGATASDDGGSGSSSEGGQDDGGGGCGCGPSSTPHAAGSLALALLGLVRRRRR